MHNEFAYQCPHCQEIIRIADDVMGGVVDCPVCETPFKVDIPSARPADPSQVNGNTPSIDRPDRAEGELKIAHPAMFRTHPLWFVGYWGLILSGLAAMMLAMWDYDIISQTFQIVAGGLLLLLGLGFLAVWWLQTRCTTLTVTTKRTILRKGIIAKKTTEVQHDDVRNIQVDQNMFERIVGIGDLAVSSSGQADLEIHVDGIPQPDEVAEMIRDQQ
jgi:hypothetical protein